MEKQVAVLQAEVERLRTKVAEWKRVAVAQAELQGEAEERAKRLEEALDELRERCAQECERLASTPCNTPTGEARALGALACADEIRAMAGEREYDDPMLPLYDVPPPVEQHAETLSVVYVDGVGAGRSRPEACRDGINYITVADTVYWPLTPEEAQRLLSAECGGGEFTGPGGTTPEVAGLVEALEDIGASWDGEGYMRNIARRALAAYRKQSADTVIDGFKRIPDLPHGFNHCAYNRQTGEWLYINHANTWQLFQGPNHDSEQGGDS